MTNTQFTEEMKKLWKGCNPNVLTKIESKLNYYNQKAIHELWIHVSETYTQQSAPSYGHICGYINDLGLKQERGGIKRQFISVCKLCDTAYVDRYNPGVENCCPNCLSEDYYMTELDQTKHDVVYTQYQCFRGNQDNHYKPAQCILFGSSGAEGPQCTSWGWQQNKAECRDCQCEDCCKRLIAENIAEYTRKKQFDAKKLAESKSMGNKQSV